MDTGELKQRLGDLWIPDIYRGRVRPMRTRSFAMAIPQRENAPEIQHTLLGIELKVGKLRLPCPDLATARYLRVFARLGCREVAVPYDISKISGIADELETTWQRMQLILADEPPRSRAKTIKAVRQEIDDVGPGEAMPAFDRETRQRRK